MEASFEDWLKERPQEIQDLGKKYPPGYYRMKEGAPYGISCAGTKVIIVSYCENGNIGIGVFAKDKLPEAIEHEKQLGKQYNKTSEEMEHIHSSDVGVEIDPKWIEPWID